MRKRQTFTSFSLFLVSISLLAGLAYSSAASLSKDYRLRVNMVEDINTFAGPSDKLVSIEDKKGNTVFALTSTPWFIYFRISTMSMRTSPCKSGRFKYILTMNLSGNEHGIRAGHN